MFGSTQRVGLADSTLEKETYESLKTEEDLEQILRGLNYGIVQPCGKCSVRIHTKCGIEIEDQVICILCSRTDAIRDQRESTKTGLEKQAAKMLALSQQKLPPIKVSQNVVVKVPDVDRGRLAPRNVLAVVLSVNESGLYKLGTKEGVLERIYSRNEFTFADSNFIAESDILSLSLTLRKALALSSGSKQGFVICHCKRYCNTKRCNCRSKEVLCNSKCHKSSPCKNKWFLLSLSLFIFRVH
ncbi:hypothetical protein RN001_012333 [Aquatica leii]|uniref:Uncharacterized protein n=1 Tax=Aquatica leii TaxID=1421715 RepID=A0AAN7S7Q6_9COLE|nr:hypothetical protein RN001_012333 [Aquatica leii]